MHSGFVGIGAWHENSFVDFPGTLATVLFYTGCNLRCPYCHNLQLARGEYPETIAPQRIRDFLRRRRGLIEGVVLSGGEPTIHPSVVDTAKEIRELGYRVKLDTNGLLPEVIERVAPDYLALDIKTRPSIYTSLLGAVFPDIAERLKRSISLVRQMGEQAEIRITAAPRCVDLDTAEEIAQLVSGVYRVWIQPLNQKTPLLDPLWNSLSVPSYEELEQIRRVIASRVGECRIRGE